SVITIPATEQVAYLRDVLSVSRAYQDPPQALAYYNGQPAIVLAVSMQKKGVNVLDFGPRVKAKVAEIEAELPIGYALDFATYQADYVAESVDGVTLNVYETLGIVLAMVMLFLGWRTGLIVGSIVPLTMLVSLVFMSVLGIELERVSLATMIIALGLLVDNGIVIAEDIGRRMAAGASRQEAALGTGRQLSLPLLTSSLTTILAFLPLMLASDSSGEYMRSMSLVIMIALMSSWLLAMCFTPLLCVWFMGEPKTTPAQVKAAYDGRVYQIYKAVLRWLLRARIPFVIAVAAGLVGGFTLLAQVPQQFFPESSRNQFYIYLDLPNGATTKATAETVQKVVAWLGDEEVNPEVVSNVAYVGYGGPRFFVPLAPRDEDPHVAFILVTASDVEAVDPLIERSRLYLAENHPEAYGRLKKFFLGNSETGLLEVRLRGRDLETVAAYGKEVEAALRAVPGALDIHNNWENRTTKVLVEIDQVRARRAGVTSEEIAQSLNTFFTGEAVTAYREGDQIIPIVLRANDAERTNMDRLRSIEVYSASGGHSVLLSEVADFVPVNQYSRIERYNLKRTVTVQAKHSWLQAVELLAAVEPALQRIEARLPAGYSIEVGGEPEDAAKGEQALFEFVPHCLALIVLILVWQFNSFTKPVIIFITIPLSFVGAAVGLLATGAFMGFMAMLGFLSLAGIIINNAIVLLDQIKVEIEQGATPYDAVINASVSRLQPVMMTTLTTILGLLPLMLPPDPLFFAMAVVIAAGLSVGTILTLATVPVLYTLFNGVKIPSKTPAAKPTPAAA
uniref:efflux RND transporter permease subunit n=1 Tax=Pelagibius sp. TaxID=1931238 RepID=UPI002603A058